jgi:hypothetical protein
VVSGSPGVPLGTRLVSERGADLVRLNTQDGDHRVGTMRCGDMRMVRPIARRLLDASHSRSYTLTGSGSGLVGAAMETRSVESMLAGQGSKA